MAELELELHRKTDVIGGAIELNGIVAHENQSPVARVHVWIGERYREVEIRVGDSVRAGEVCFRLMSIDLYSSIGIEIQDIEISSGTVEFGTAFEAIFGRRLRLPSGQDLTLTAIGHFGFEVFFGNKSECENFAWLDYGFWRNDDLLFEVLGTDMERGSVTLIINPEEHVNRQIAADYGGVLSLGPRDLAHFPDGVSLSLRRATRRSYDAVDWDMLAKAGDDVSYPYGSIRASDGKAKAEDHGFGLLANRYNLQLTKMNLAPELKVTLVIRKEANGRFVLGEVFTLDTTASMEGPEGVAVHFLGSGHAHGTSLGPDGEEEPYTEAWADFRVLKGTESESFQVDLMNLEASASHVRFGLRITVAEVGDQTASLRVDRV